MIRCALLVALFFSVSAAVLAAAPPSAEPRSYLQLPRTGKYAAIPYVWERSGEGARLAVIGTRHLRDPRAPMFDRIEAVFERLQPQVVLHEGFAPDELKTMSRDAAIGHGADLGFTLYLAHAKGLPVRSADAPVAQEIAGLLKQYSAQEVLVFMVAQRLIRSGTKPDLAAAEAEYAEFFIDYLVGNGLPDTPRWRSWPGFLEAYRQVTGQALTAQSWHADRVTPVRDIGRLNQVARASLMLRDQYLLAAIRHSLCDYERIVVVFGSWHVLALEPVLQGLSCQRSTDNAAPQ